MDADQRENTLLLLFGSTVEKLDKLRASGVPVPSEVYMYLGMLQGNISGIMNHIATNHEIDLERMQRAYEQRLAEFEDDDDEQEDEGEPEVPMTRMEQVSSKYATPVEDEDRSPGEERSPLTRHRTVVKMRERDE